MTHRLPQGFLMFYKAGASKCMQALKAVRKLNKACDAMQGGLPGNWVAALTLPECTQMLEPCRGTWWDAAFFQLIGDLWVCMWERVKVGDSADLCCPDVQLWSKDRNSTYVKVVRNVGDPRPHLTQVFFSLTWLNRTAEHFVSFLCLKLWNNL